MEDEINPEKIEWDYVVVGTGVGGATLGHALAKAGKKVLFCEKGLSDLNISSSLTGKYAECFFPAPGVPGSQHGDILAKAGRYNDDIVDESIQKKFKTYIPFLGTGTGGSSALYGAAMERFWPEDFEPAKETASRFSEQWPFSYSEFEPYYKQAEALYRVRGNSDPLRESLIDQELMSAPPFCPANETLFEFLKNKQLHPYRLPVACEFVSGCQSCQGFICSRNCKNDSVRMCLKPAIETYGAMLLDCCEIIRIESDGKCATKLLANWKGRTIHLSGKNFILAAGALATPVILLRSGGKNNLNGLANESGMVGRNLMRHFVDMYALLSGPKPRVGDNSKEIAFNDFYLNGGEKFGSVQSFGWMPPASIMVETIEGDIKAGAMPLAAYLFKGVKPLARFALEKMLCNRLVLASTLEDTPCLENRVMPAGPGNLRFSYQISDYDKLRIKEFRKRLKQAFHPLKYALIKQAENNERLAHVCGTCRMGDDPAKAVVNKFNQTYGVENLYIVDSSFFPSSGGTNPSLTIAANALRVAKHIL